MTICPIAIAIGCKKCPIFKVCPVKGTIGDFKPEAPAASIVRPPSSMKTKADAASKAKPKAKPRKK